MGSLISNQEFTLFRDMIYHEAGINLTEQKKPLLVTRLRKRFDELHIDSFTEYYRVISRDETEMVRLLDCVSTNLTEFFRERAHFDFLKGRFLDEKKAKAVTNRKIRVWCAAASTGEEPYSIAMTLMEGLKGCGTWDVKILASDINTTVLKTAEKAVYVSERLKKVPKPLWKAYFLKGRGENSDNYRMKEHIKNLLIFRRFNLKKKEWPIGGGFDVIFCRNVLIYFDAVTRTDVIERLSRYLNPGGYIIVGHSETLTEKGRQFKVILPSVYQKVGV